MSDLTRPLHAPTRRSWSAIAASLLPRTGRPPLVHLLGAAMALAACWRIWHSFGHMLWLDELYTTTLIETPSLTHMWDGALRGVDGNPPLYLSLCWFVTQGFALEPERILRPLNLLILAATAVLQYRIGRRLADPVSVAVGLSILCAVDGMLAYALLEVRTYALYLLLTTATLWGTLRVVDRPSPARITVLAGLGILTALAHSFGGFYVLATLGAAGLVCLFNRDRQRMVALAVSALPAAATTVGWFLLLLPVQRASATPYGWIPVPDLPVLVAALTGSLLLTPILAIGLCGVAVSNRRGLGRAAARSVSRPDIAALYAALAAYAALTLAGWIGSQMITPFFVARYFIPNVTIAAMLIIPAIGSARRRVRAGLSAMVIVIGSLAGLGSIAHDDGMGNGFIPCLDSDGRFLEDGIVGDALPVVAESPLAWLPRNRYAPRQLTLYPLDWEVVLRYPHKARNNAMDFHIMEMLQNWGEPGSALSARLLSTADILAQNPRFLVLDESSRAWLDNLRATVPLSARLLKQNEGCRLWEVGAVTTPAGD